MALFNYSGIRSLLFEYLNNICSPKSDRISNRITLFGTQLFKYSNNSNYSFKHSLHSQPDVVFIIVITPPLSNYAAIITKYIQCWLVLHLCRLFPTLRGSVPHRTFCHQEEASRYPEPVQSPSQSVKSAAVSHFRSDHNVNYLK